MPYQSTESYTPPSDNRPPLSTHHYSSLISTQPTSNISQLINPNIQHSITSSQSTIAPGPPIVAFGINNLYSCRTILDTKKHLCKTRYDYFKILYCMYSGCIGNARSRINTLLENKHSSVSIRSIKTVKKTVC